MRAPVPPLFCDRCGNPFTPGDEVEPYDQFSPSGAVPTVYLHKQLCRRPGVPLGPETSPAGGSPRSPEG